VLSGGKVTGVGRWISVEVWSLAYFVLGELSWSKTARTLSIEKIRKSENK
jgi:hypothetical protein